MRTRTFRYYRLLSHPLPLVGLLAGVRPHVLFEGLPAGEIPRAALLGALEIVADLSVSHGAYVP